MLIKQFYETTIYDVDSSLEGRFIVVPRIAYERIPENITNFRELAGTLGLIVDRELQPSELALGVSICLGEEHRFMEDNTDSYPSKFGEVLAFAPVVPFQRNPLNLESLASIITGATGVGLGAFAGFVIAPTGSALILITVPAGMIIFGASAGIARALEEGLRDRIKRLINNL